MSIVSAAGLMQLGMAFMMMSTGNNWAFVSEGKQGAVWYVDIESLRDERDDDGQPVRRAVIKTQYAAVSAGPAKDIKRLILFKCQDEISKTLSYTEYDAVGMETRSYAYPTPAYDAVVPGTVLASAMAKACSTPQQ